jgi:hypothetical protein
MERSRKAEMEVSKQQEEEIASSKGKSRNGDGECSETCRELRPPLSVIEITGVIEDKREEIAPGLLVWPLEVEDKSLPTNPATKDRGKQPIGVPITIPSAEEKRKPDYCEKSLFDGSGIPRIGPPRRLNTNCDHHMLPDGELEQIAPSRDCEQSTNQSNSRVWPARVKSLMRKIEKAMQWKPPSPFDSTDIRFEMTLEAAKENYRILADHQFDLQKIITSPSATNTPLRPGSEFRPVHLLAAICRNHPMWSRIRRMMTEGFTMPLTELRRMMTEGFTMPLTELPDLDRIQVVH